MAKQGFPHSRLYAISRSHHLTLRQRCLASLLDMLDSLTSDLTAVIFHIPTFINIHTVRFGGLSRQLSANQSEAVASPALRMRGEPHHFRPTVKLLSSRKTFNLCAPTYEFGAPGLLSGLPDAAIDPIGFGWRSGPSVWFGTPI